MRARSPLRWQSGARALLLRTWASSISGSTARAAEPRSSPAREGRVRRSAASGSTRARSRPRARSASTTTGASCSRVGAIDPFDGQVGSPRRVRRRGGASARLRASRAAGGGGRRDRAARASSASGWTATAATARPRTTLNFYWTARIVEGVPEPADDVAEFRWFAPVGDLGRRPRVPAHARGASRARAEALVARPARSRTAAASRAVPARRRSPRAAIPLGRRP